MINKFVILLNKFVILFSACEYEGEKYGHGESFKPFGLTDPCMVCTCDNGEVGCENIKSKCPLLTCENPKVPTGECCPVCQGKYQLFISVLKEVKGNRRTLPMTFTFDPVRGQR